MTTREHAPQGFIGRIQAHRCGDLEELYESISQYLSDNEITTIEKHLRTLQCKGFSTVWRENCIYLKPEREYSDHGYFTKVDIRFNETYIGWARIGFKGQKLEKDHTLDRLPDFFEHLSSVFFSRIEVNEKTTSSNFVASLRFLLRDVRTFDQDEINAIKSEPVFKASFMIRPNKELHSLIWGQPR